MEAVCSKCPKYIPQFKDNKTIQYYRMCDTSRSKKTNLYVDCINYDKSNLRIT